MIDYGRIYKDITSLDPKIRLVTICDRNGITMFSQHREGIKNLLSPEEQEVTRTSYKRLENKK